MLTVCDGKSDDDRLTYEDLKRGDIFSYVNDVSRGILIKINDGRVYLIGANGVKAGTFYTNARSLSDSPVLRYPNACIILGDPE